MQLDALQNNVNQLLQLTASTPTIAGRITPEPQNKTAESSNGFFNLNQLLETPHKNTYLWAALTLLGILAVWAGLRIQSRKTARHLSTLTSSENIEKSSSMAPQISKLEMPANIAALDLNLDLPPQANTNFGSVRSRASTETLQ